MVDEMALEAMSAYHWPGNIRELQNVIERAVVLCEGHQITVADLPHAVAQATFQPQAPATASPPTPRPRPVPEMVAQRTVIGSEGERQQLVEAMQRCGGNKAEAARLLGIPRSTFFSKLRRHGLG
jgi:transcriptional regulator of acetoin/glycerol metabolism